MSIDTTKGIAGLKGALRYVRAYRDQVFVVKLGGDAAASSLVLGEALLLAFNTHMHNCTAPGAPSGPPIVQMTPATVLSQVSKTA